MHHVNLVLLAHEVVILGLQVKGQLETQAVGAEDLATMSTVVLPV